MRKLIMLVILCAGSVFAQDWGVTDWAVSPDGDDDTGDGTLANPFQTIQKGVDTATTAAGHTVWVTNGVYDTGVGGVHISGGHSLSNRVYNTKNITIRSFNGPEVTTIKGRWHDPDVTTNILGTAAIRPVYMTDGELIGFTVTGGATREQTWPSIGAGGGIFTGNTKGSSAVIRNCRIVDNRARYGGAGVSSGTIYDSQIVSNRTCTITGTSSYQAGGVIFSTVYNSLISYNDAVSKYATGDSDLFDCVVINNTGGFYSTRGAITGGTVWRCLIMSNTVSSSRQSAVGTGTVVHDSIIAWNRTGVERATIYNSLIVGNYTEHSARDSYLYNCTVVGNDVNVDGGTNYNSIIYHNTVNWNTTRRPIFYHSCTTPAQTNQADFNDTNITNAPQFVSLPTGYGLDHDWTTGNYRPKRGSPVIGKGDNGAWDMAGTFDLGDVIELPADWVPPPYPASLFKNRRPRTIGGTVDMGAYEADVGLGMPWRTGGTPWILLQ